MPDIPVEEFVDDVTPLILNPRDPLPSARAFVKAKYTINGLATLRHHSGVFHAWAGAAYHTQDEAALRAELYDFLAQCRCPTGKSATAPFQPDRTKIADVLDALKAVTNLPSTTSAPAWLDGSHAHLPAHELIACRNGLLHLPTLDMLPVTPAFFGLNALDFDFDPKPPEPTNWLRFLWELWPDDPESTSTLQEIAGYALTADTAQQKIFMVVGPRRSGKGTIGRVLTALLGRPNVCAPTLASLSANFGLAPLIGKQLGIISDARLGSRADQAAITERLLSISGEDSLTVDRKYLPAWTGQMPTRFLVLTNELPRLADTSGALAGRFILLTLEQSFYGREDPGLTARLLTELPGILQWAIDGWHRLAKRGYFIQPQAAQDAMRELETLGSPMLAFLADRCTVARGAEADCDQLYTAWTEWCQAQGRKQPGTKQTFGRDLRAAAPGLRTRQYRDGQDRFRFYQGIGLK